MPEATERRVSVTVEDAVNHLDYSTTHENLVAQGVHPDRARTLVQHRDENIVQNLRQQKDWNTLITFLLDRFGLDAFEGIFNAAKYSVTLDTSNKSTAIYDYILGMVMDHLREKAGA